MTFRAITGNIKDVTGTATAGATIEFTPVSFVYGTTASEVVLADSFTVTADGSGDVSFTAHEGVYTGSVQTSAGVKRFNLVVDSEGPWTLGRLVGLASQFTPSIAQQIFDAKDDAEAAAVLAQSAYQGRQYETRALFVADTAYVNGAETPTDGTVVTAGGLAYVRSAGATAIPGLPGWLPFGRWKLRHFIEPNTPGANLALVAAVMGQSGRAVVDLEDKAWLFSDNAILPRDRIELTGNGARIIYDTGTADFSSLGRGMVQIEHPDSAPVNESGTTVTSDIPEGAIDITVASTAEFSQGGFVRIMSGLSNETGEYFYGIPGSGGFNSVRKMEMAQVLSVVDATTLRLTAPVAQSYDATTYTVYVDPCEYGRDVEITGIHFVGEGGSEGFPGSGNPASPHGVSIEGINGVRITDCTFENHPRHQASLRFCWDVIVANNTIRGPDLTLAENVESNLQSVWFTGVNFAATTNIVFSGNTTSNARRPCDFQGGGSTPPCRNIMVTGNTSYNCLDMQGSHICDRMSVVGNFGYGCGRMMSYRGKNLVLHDNYCEVVTTGARYISVGDGSISSGIYDDIGLNCGTLSVKNNTVKGVAAELYFVAQCDIDSLELDGNVFTGMTTATISAAVAFISRRLRNIKITGNTIDCSGVTGILRVIDNLRRGDGGSQVVDGYEVSGNTMIGGSAGIRFTPPHPDFSEMGANNIILGRNTFIGQTARNIELRTGANFQYKRPVVIKGNVGFGTPSTANIGGSSSVYVTAENTWSVDDL